MSLATYIYDVLLSYIYPRLFVCRDKNDCRYLFYEMSSDSTRDLWLVAGIKDGEYHELKGGKIPLQKVYKSKQYPDIFAISIDYADNDKISMNYEVDELIRKLPDIDVYTESSAADV